MYDNFKVRLLQSGENHFSYFAEASLSDVSKTPGYVQSAGFWDTGRGRRRTSQKNKKLDFDLCPVSK